METEKKEAIVVIAIGEKFKNIYDTYFRESQERFAKKIGVPLIILNDYIDKSERSLARSPSWQKLLMFDVSQTENYDRLCYIDADIYITKKAKNPFENTENKTFGVVKNNPYNFPEERVSNLELYNYCPKENRPKYIINSGFFVAERNIHKKTFEYVYNHYEEQPCYENGPLSYHMLTEHKITDLDIHFNNIIPNLIKKYGFLWVFKLNKGGFIHFCGKIHEEMVNYVQDIDNHPIYGIYRTMLNKIRKN